MKAIFTGLLGLLLGTSLFAQTGKIKGKIYQSGIDKPLSGVHIYLNKTKLGAATNGSGSFIISKIPDGTYTIEASNIGFEKYRQDIVIQDGQTVLLDIKMDETVISLPGVVVERVTMTGGSKGVMDVPGSAYYISPKEIQRFGYNDINRTLRTVPGINIQEEDGFGLRPNIGMRGTGVERSSKITVMEDGILMAPAPYAAPAAYYFPTAGRMQAVEVVKGSSQVRYGPYTTGGAINFVSTQIPSDLSGNISLLAGNFGSRTVQANLGDSYKNFGYMVETYQALSDGFKELDGGGDTGFDKKDYMAKVRVNTNPGAPIYQSLTFKIGQTLETSDETYLGLTDQDFSATPYRRYSASQLDQINTDQLRYQLTHVFRPLKFMDVTTTLYRTEFNRNWYKLDKVKSDVDAERVSIDDILVDPVTNLDAFNIITGGTSPNDDALELKNNNRSYYAQGIQSLIGFQFGKGELGHDIELGIRYHEDQVDRFQWVDKYRMEDGVMFLTEQGIPGTESNRVTTATALATHILYKLTYRKITVTPGLRYESISLKKRDYGKNDVGRTGTDLEVSRNDVNVLIPGLGIDYKFNPGLSAFAGVHKGFSPPGASEGSEPENSVNYELGSRFSHKGLSGQAVLFVNDYKNLLGSDLAAAGGAGSNEQFNAGEALAQGLEFLITYDPLYGSKSKFSLPITFAYTYTDATFRNSFESDFDAWGNVEDGDFFPYLAQNQFSLVAAFESRKLNVNLSSKYMDEMRTVAGQGEIPEDLRIESYFIIDASAEYRINQYVGFFGSLKNLANSEYAVARRPAGLRPGMPRSFLLGVKVRF